MNTIRIIGIALLTVLMCVAISSCSKSDDDNNGGGSSSTSIEGTWYMKSQIGYVYFPDGTIEPHNSTKEDEEDRTFPDYADDRIWELTKNGEDFTCKITWKGRKPFTSTWIKTSTNEYKCTEGSSINKIVIKTLTNKQMVLEWHDNFYKKAQTRTIYNDGRIYMIEYTLLRK